MNRCPPLITRQKLLRSGEAVAALLVVPVISCLFALSTCADEHEPGPAATNQSEAYERDAQPGAEAGERKDNGELSLPELMSRIYLAYGGKEAFAELDQNYMMSGHQKIFASVTAAETAVAFRQIRKGPKLRIDLESSPESGKAAPSVTTFDGAFAWKSHGSWVSQLPAGQAKLLAEERDRQPSVLVHWKESGYDLLLVGRTQYRQVPVLSVELFRPDRSPTTFYVDQSNYLIVGASYNRKDPDLGRQATINTDYGQYRPVGGTMVPFKQSQSINNKPSLEIDLETVQLDVALDDRLFRKPDQGLAMKLANAVTIPFEYSHSEILIKARINDSEPLDFLFDTGASDTIIDRRTAAEHYLDKEGSMSITAASGAVPTQTSLVKKLEIGSLPLQEVQALILDLTPQSRQLGCHVAGIIGANVLGQFVVTIDYSKPAITLYDPATYSAPEAASMVAFTQRNGPMVKATLNGRDEQVFLIDTGAAFNHLPAAIARRYTAGQPLHVTEGTGLDGRPVRLGIVFLDSVELGGQKARQVNFTYPVQEESARDRGGFFQVSEVGVLGNPFWQNFLLTLDWRLQRLFVQPNPVKRAKQDIDQLIVSGDAKLIVSREYRQAEACYQRALLLAQGAADAKNQARIFGRLGNLHRVMAKDLNRPDQARVAYDYFSKAQVSARKLGDREIEGRILADLSILYSDNGQVVEARQTIESALQMSPQDPAINVDCAVHFYRARDFLSMQRYVEKTLFLDPSNWQALWYQVKLSELFFDRARLQTTLKEILRFYPWSKLARDKLAQLTPPEPGTAPATAPPVNAQQPAAPPASTAQSKPPRSAAPAVPPLNERAGSLKP